MHTVNSSIEMDGFTRESHARLQHDIKQTPWLSAEENYSIAEFSNISEFIEEMEIGGWPSFDIWHHSLIEVDLKYKQAGVL